MEKQTVILPYAVVSFLEEGSTDEYVSEVPSNWLVGNTHCYWPSSKNVNSLISKMAVPDPADSKWKLYEVQINCFCDSLQNARRKAESVNSSSDEAPKGRGMRKKKKSLKVIQENSSEEEDDIDFRGIPNFPSNTTSEFQGYKEISKTADIYNIEDIPVAIISGNLSSVSEVHNSTTSINVNKSPDNLDELKIFLAEKFSVVLNSLASLNMNITDLNRRLQTMEQNSIKSKHSLREEDIEEMLMLLPVTCIENLNKLEQLILSSQNKSNLNKYFINIGGSNTKENIIRVLKKVFTNKFAVQCSWLGQRNNIRICDLKIIMLIKAAVAENFPHNDKEFENVCSEWFRQAKQRLIRELQKEVVSQ